MLLIEEIDNYYLLSLAFSDARISDPEQTLKQLRSINNKAEVQLVKSDLIAGPEHLQFAARNALSSFKGPRRRSKSLAMELLLYISCERQIAKAIKILGVDSEDSRIALVALSDSKGAIQDLDRQARSVVGGNENEDLIEIGSKQKMARLQRSYGVAGTELEAARLEGEADSSVLKRLIVERSALLDIEDYRRLFSFSIPRIPCGEMTDTPATSPITSISTILSGLRSSTFRGTFEATASMISFEETRLRRFSRETLNVSSTPTFPARFTTAAPILGMSQGTTSSTGLTFRMYLNCQGRYFRTGRSFATTFTGSREVFATVSPLTSAKSVSGEASPSSLSR